MEPDSPRVIASAPGKVILMGEHSVVYGRPALVAALGLRARARASAGRTDGVTVELAEVGHRETVDWSELVAVADRARKAWEEYAATPVPAVFAGLAADGPAALVKVALGEVAAELGEARLPPLSLRVASEIPVGSGFGSSAAVAVAVLAATLGFLDAPPAEARLERLALEVERRQHGSPSGVDHRTVLAGGMLRYEPGDPPRLRSVTAGGLLSRLLLVHTGRAAESTGEVVAAVRRRRDGDPARFEGLLESMASAVGDLEEEIPRRRENPGRVVALLRRFEACLEELGVVPQAVQTRIRRLESLGAAAKVCGAGALSGEGGGGMIVYRPPGAADPEPALAGLRRYRAQLGAPGWRLEEAA